MFTQCYNLMVLRTFKECTFQVCLRKELRMPDGRHEYIMSCGDQTVSDCYVRVMDMFALTLIATLLLSYITSCSSFVANINEHITYLVIYIV